MTGSPRASRAWFRRDLLVLLSDVDGLYTAPPGEDPQAEHISIIARVTPEIEAMAGGAASQFSRGGMRTKIEAAKIATSGGAHMVIADGREPSPLKRIAQGARCSWFLSPSNPLTRAKNGSPARSRRRARRISTRAQRRR